MSRLKPSQKKKLETELELLRGKLSRCCSVTARPGHKASKHARTRWTTIERRIHELEGLLGLI